MKEKKIKMAIAKKICATAKRIAYKTVGKNWPTGLHEVVVPKELRGIARSHETNQ